MNAPAPGIYTREQIPDYTSIVAVNQSVLKHIGKSPLHMKYRASGNAKPTTSMRLGTTAHTAILEPDRLESDFAIYKAGITVTLPDGKTGVSNTDVMNGKVWDTFREYHTALGHHIIKQPELDSALRVRKAVFSNRDARRYLDMGQAERILVWRDERTGLLCKARLDWISQSVRDVLVELKTAADVSPRAFASNFAKLQYDVQTAWYIMGHEAITGRTLYPKAIAVENAEPHDVVVYDLAEVVDRGKELAREYLDLYAKCRNAGEWPGQGADGEKVLTLPFWRRGLDDDDETDFFGTLAGRAEAHDYD
jgi:hypothetical protein